MKKLSFVVSLITMTIFIRSSDGFPEAHDHPHPGLGDLYEGDTLSPQACSSLQLRRCRLAFPFRAFPWASCNHVVEKVDCLIRKGCTRDTGLDQWLQFYNRLCKHSQVDLPESFKRMALRAGQETFAPVPSRMVFFMTLVVAMTTVG